MHGPWKFAAKGAKTANDNLPDIAAGGTCGTKPVLKTNFHDPPPRDPTQSPVILVHMTSQSGGKSDAGAVFTAEVEQQSKKKRKIKPYHSLISTAHILKVYQYEFDVLPAQSRFATPSVCLDNINGLGSLHR